MKINNFCPNCGFQFIYKNAVKCPKCKTDFRTRIRHPKHCTNCGEIFDYSKSLIIPICESCGAKTEDELDFSLRIFLIENSNLFVIFGVFIALSVYLAQFISNYNIAISSKGLNFSTNFFEIAIGSSLLIAFIILLVIFNGLIKGNLFEKIFEFLSSYMPSFPIGMFIQFLFLIPFFFLMTGILLFLLATYQTTVIIFLSAIFVVIAITLFILGIAVISNTVFPRNEKSNVRKPIQLYIILYSVVIALISKISLEFFPQIIEKGFMNVVFSAILTAFFWTLLIASILGILAMIFLIAFTWNIQRSKNNNNS